MKVVEVSLSLNMAFNTGESSCLLGESNPGSRILGICQCHWRADWLLAGSFAVPAVKAGYQSTNQTNKQTNSKTARQLSQIEYSNDEITAYYFCPQFQIPSITMINIRTGYGKSREDLGNMRNVERKPVFVWFCASESEKVAIPPYQMYLATW